MNRKLVCALLAGALIGTVSLSGCKAPAGEVPPSPTVTPEVIPSPHGTAEELPVQALTGREGNAPYLTCGGLTATTQDYVEAVRDVGNALALASWREGVPLQEYLINPDLSALLGGDIIFIGDPIYHWDSTVDGVPFDRYLAQQARVQAFYRAWSQSELDPTPTQEEFQAWAAEQEASGGYLRFYDVPVESEETAQLVQETLNQDESRLSEVWATYSLAPEADIEYAGPSEEFVPAVSNALASADGQWTVVEYSYQGDDKVYFIVIKALPLTMENYRGFLLAEAWPTAIDADRICLAEGVEELDAPQLYEDWYAWAVENNISIISSSQLLDGAVIAPPEETDPPSQQGQSI